MLQRTALRAGHAHHVSEGGEDNVGILGDGEAVVDSAHGENADWATRAVDEFNVGGKKIFQAETVDGVSMAAAHFHDAVVAIGISEPANLRRGFRDELGLAKLVDKLHAQSFFKPGIKMPGEGSGFSAVSIPYPVSIP